MNRLLKLDSNFTGGLFLSAAMLPGFSALADNCVTKYDPGNPVIALFEQVAKMSPLVPSKWESVQTKGLNFDFENGGSLSGDVIVRVTAVPDAQKQTILDEVVAKVKIPTFASRMVDQMLQAGFPFSATLCARADNSLYINLVGIGSASGHNGKIDVKPEPNSIHISGDFAGSPVDGSVQISK